jgi:uncharacterized protein (DUF1330 family)
MHFIDVLTVRKGVSPEKAYAYFDKACPILARHGFTRLTAYEVKQKMRGHDEVNPTIVQIWQTRGPEGFQSLTRDPDYNAIVPERDSIFDMGKLQGWFAEEVSA